MNTMPAGRTRAGTRSGTRPAECTTVHTRILRCMLAADDCAAYWRHVDMAVPAANRASVAFAQRWFGIKSEARVRTIMTDMAERFDAYPEALALLHRVGRIPVAARTLICHVHTQLADPVYRRFAGTFLAERREQGRGTIDRAVVARWVDTLAPGRWSPATCTKFASNLLATALDVGLVRGRRDPRKLPHLVVPEVAIGYALYLLRGVRIEGSLTDNPYLRSLGVTSLTLRTVAPRTPGVRIAELGGVAEVTFLEPTLTAWGLHHLGEAA